jgi:2-C-methyl-D-erythritol 2,4-cyclodiphosphate synthase
MTGRVGIGFDTHRFSEGRPLKLGGVTIPHTQGLAGHSDADALIHAIVDALLGALALGNIGTHFPNDDPKWKDAASELFLRETLLLVRDRRYRVVNVDATVVAEAPKLAPLIEEIRASLAGMLGVGVDDVSVKATTAEGLGAIGRAEGIACMAVAMLTSDDEGA